VRSHSRHRRRSSTAVDAGAPAAFDSLIRLDLSAGTKTAALTVRNDAQEVLVQAEMMLWEQVDGEDRLTPTRDLLVSPAVFTLPPNGSQLVRVALRHVPADVTRELAYRLILQEVPQPANPDAAGLRVTLRLSVPVFVATAGATGPDLAWSAAVPQVAAGTARCSRQPVAHTSCPVSHTASRADTGTRQLNGAVAGEGHDRRRRIRDRTDTTGE
jgi:fimbrial chaperone protein